MKTYRVQSGGMKETVQADDCESAFEIALQAFESKGDRVLGLIVEFRGIPQTGDIAPAKTFYMSTEALLRKLGKWEPT